MMKDKISDIDTEHELAELDVELLSPTPSTILETDDYELDMEEYEEKSQKTVVTFGTFDLPHIGHVKIIQRAKAFGDKLFVGVSSDSLNYRKKQKYPVYNENERMGIISNMKGVSGVFLEESLEKKREYLLKHNADVLVMGNDWEGKFDSLSDICKVIYLPRTENVSTTEIIESIINEK